MDHGGAHGSHERRLEGRIQHGRGNNMSLQCAQCKSNVVYGDAVTKLAFCEDGLSLHLVMSTIHEGGKSTRFKLLETTGSGSSPFKSIMKVLCANETPSGVCNHKIGAVRCHPPLSDNQLIFFQRKALLVDGVRPRTWRVAKDTSLKSVPIMPAHDAEKLCRFTPQERPPLVKSLADGTYQVLGCERNSLVYLPTGLGKTLVAVMVLHCLLELNPDRQAFFLVETTALAMQQAAALREEMRCSVELMVGSSMLLLGDGGAEESSAQQRLVDIRGAKVVVATAGAFEFAMSKHYVDPDSICCVVLDEAHHCVKEHPFNRIVKSFLNPEVDISRPRASDASKLPKVVALTASPAGEKTIEATRQKIEALLDRLRAHLVSPVKTLPEVKERTPRVNLELVSVSATLPEKIPLNSLQILVLKCVVELAPWTDARMQADKLLKALDKVAKGPGESTTETVSATSGSDDSWRFPNKAYTALCQQAFAVRLEHLSAKPASRFEKNLEDNYSTVTQIINLAFAVDEMGGEATWRWALEKLKKLHMADGGDLGRALSEAVSVLEKHLSEDSRDERRKGAGLPKTAARQERTEHHGPVGSKLEKISVLLKEHKERCDRSNSNFSALVFVSTRELAKATAGMLEAVPILAPFVKAQHIVGLTDMTQVKQRVALDLFREGTSNVMVSTSVCGEGIDVPACTLVLCASLPNSGTALVQLRGRIRCEENSRFVGLSRNCDEADKEHVKTICLRETNMLMVIELLTKGKAVHSRVTTNS